MLSTRLWMGSVLIGLVVGMLAFDERLPFFPIQLGFQVFLAIVASVELLRLMGRDRAPIVPLCYLGVITLTLFNWIFRAVKQYHPMLDIGSGNGHEVRFWTYLLGLFVFFQLIAFCWEMATFRAPGQSVERIARTIFVIAYLGLLPSFFAQIRWLYDARAGFGTAALALAIFVPKGCDIGAYFTGRLIGKHPMTPVLSPKKTWEGAIGGLAFACLIAIGIDRFGPSPVLREHLALEVAFGLSVGLAGMLGDLAESLIKRDCQQKDASQAVPGFGGVLDVVDAVIFAAPVAFAWFLILNS